MNRRGVASHALVGISAVVAFGVSLAFPLLALLVLLGHTLFPDVHQIDVLVLGHVVDDGGQRVAFLLGAHDGQGVVQLDVGIVGIIEWRGDVPSVIHMHGQPQS